MTREQSVQYTRQKAFEINQNPLVYGTIAEVGAGQEVARHFFQAGSASGTVAKTLSAYDMQMSDSLYGVDPSGRYVSLGRLESMLETEFVDLRERVSERRSMDTTYFAFADTVAAKSYKSEHDCHGWMGLQFQHAPKADPSQVVMHVRMLDPSNRDQQEALGILGVNLIHAAFFRATEATDLVDALIEHIAWGRIEIDYIRLKGPCFEGADNLKVNLRLVTSSLGPVVVIRPNREAAVPAEVVFRKHLLVLRGTFRPFTDTHADMIRCGVEAFADDLNTSERDIERFCEMNVAQYLSDGVDEVSDLESRVLDLTGRGYNVMVTSHFRYFRVSEYFTKLGRRRIGFVLSVDNIRAIMHEAYYDGLAGGILEAMARLFSSDVKLLVYPNLETDGSTTTAENVEIPDSQKYLYRHLRHNGRLLPLRPDPEKLVPFEHGEVPEKSHDSETEESS